MGRRLRVGPPVEPHRLAPFADPWVDAGRDRRGDRAGHDRDDGRGRCRAAGRSSSPRPRPRSIGCPAGGWCSGSGSASTATASTRCSTSRPPTTRPAARRSTPGSSCCVPMLTRRRPSAGGVTIAPRRAAAPGADLDRRPHRVPRPVRGGSPATGWRAWPWSTPSEWTPAHVTDALDGRRARPPAGVDVVLVGGDHPDPDALAAAGATWCMPEILPGATAADGPRPGVGRPRLTGSRNSSPGGQTSAVSRTVRGSGQAPCGGDGDGADVAQQEGVVARAVAAQLVEAGHRLVDARHVAGRHPPAHDVDVHLLEPLPAPPQVRGVIGAVHEVVELLGRLPHRQVDDQQRVVVGADVARRQPGSSSLSRHTKPGEPSARALIAAARRRTRPSPGGPAARAGGRR